ncbi:MAG: hypothetical protein NXI08_13020 [bacterium]|nr:hypothetical protein [bacterium]
MIGLIIQTSEYNEFIEVLGALALLVTISVILERALAFLYEHKWFMLLFPNQSSRDKKERDIRRYIAAKENIALIVSFSIAFTYKFDILQILFKNPSWSWLGIILTAFILAGGSAGAIAIFQGYLRMGKEVRDANIEALKSEAEAREIRAKIGKSTTQTEG